jgi:hypothetical protein
MTLKSILLYLFLNLTPPKRSGVDCDVIVQTVLIKGRKGFIWVFLARRDDCPESYCHDLGVGVSVTPQGKNFNLGYIF